MERGGGKFEQSFDVEKRRGSNVLIYRNEQSFVKNMEFPTDAGLSNGHFICLRMSTQAAKHSL